MKNAYERATPHKHFGANILPSGFWAPLFASILGLRRDSGRASPDLRSGTPLWLSGGKNCPRALGGVRRGLAHARGVIWSASLVFYRGIRQGPGHPGAHRGLPRAPGRRRGPQQPPRTSLRMAVPSRPGSAAGITVVSFHCEFAAAGRRLGRPRGQR